MSDTILEVQELKKYFPIEKGFMRRVVGQVRAVDKVSFSVAAGQTLGLVGESGCGKSTAGRTLVRLLEPTDGVVRFRTQDGAWVDVSATRDRKQLRQLWQEMTMIFQDPSSSLNPRRRVLEVVGEPLMEHKVAKGKALQNRVGELLEMVGLRPEYMMRYPHAFSGGQRQRLAIARALTLQPRFIICDEVTSALDVSVQAQILNLLQRLQRELGLAYLFISHDLSSVEHISDEVGVMYVGQLVERAATQRLYSKPLHPYTEALLSAVPRPDPLQKVQRVRLHGDVANAAAPPAGCYFHPRCQYVEDRCKSESPLMRELEPGHWVRCHRAEELNLQGVVPKEAVQVV